MEQTIVDLSIVIVSFNVRDVLRDCLISVRDAVRDLKAEVWVVDNHSSDNSVEMIKNEFPDVRLLALSENVGFSRGNNAAIGRARGKFVLLLNPDTVVNAEALERVLSFMEKNPRIGAAGCRLVMRSGRIDKACRRSLPTPWNALCQMFRLDRLFPTSRRLAAYNLSYLDERGCYPVECLVGAFMMVRHETVDQVGLLDEQFFMYGEDVDWCYRIKETGWQIQYLGDVSILHLKGESSRKQSYRMIREFHRAMLLYYRKHFRGEINPVLYGAVQAGIALRYVMSCVANATRSNKRVS